MLLMLVIFGKFGSFLVVEAFRVGWGTRRSLYCIFMQLTFAAGYRILFRGWVSRCRCFIIQYMQCLCMAHLDDGPGFYKLWLEGSALSIFFAGGGGVSIWGSFYGLGVCSSGL